MAINTSDKIVGEVRLQIFDSLALVLAKCLSNEPDS